MLQATFTIESQVIGIILEALKTLRYLPGPPIGEELVVLGMQERIIKMLKHAKAFIFLLRDLTTLEALITFASWTHLNIHHKLISLLNANNFYDGLIAFINHVIKNHFISYTVKKIFICASTANELLDLLEAYKLELDPKILTLDWSTDNGHGSSNKHKWDLCLCL